MSRELLEHLGLPQDVAPDVLHAAALGFLSADTSKTIPNPKRARLLLAARRATGETFPRRPKGAAPGQAAPPEATALLDAAIAKHEEAGQLRKAAGDGLACQPPCKGVGRLRSDGAGGFLVFCPACRKTVPGRTAGEAVRAWEKETGS